MLCPPSLCQLEFFRCSYLLRNCCGFFKSNNWNLLPPKVVEKCCQVQFFFALKTRLLWSCFLRKNCTRFCTKSFSLEISVTFTTVLLGCIALKNLILVLTIHSLYTNSIFVTTVGIKRTKKVSLEFSHQN